VKEIIVVLFYIGSDIFVEGRRRQKCLNHIPSSYNAEGDYSASII
jgi:hypothetical protein